METEVCTLKDIQKQPREGASTASPAYERLSILAHQHVDKDHEDSTIHFLERNKNTDLIEADNIEAFEKVSMLAMMIWVACLPILKML